MLGRVLEDLLDAVLATLLVAVLGAILYCDLCNVADDEFHEELY